MNRRGFLKAALGSTIVIATGGLSTAGILKSLSTPEYTMPIGTILPFAESGIVYKIYAGAKWLPCDGRTISREEYLDLFDSLNIGSLKGATPNLTKYNRGINET